MVDGTSSCSLGASRVRFDVVGSHDDAAGTTRNAEPLARSVSFSLPKEQPGFDAVSLSEDGASSSGTASGKVSLTRSVSFSLPKQAVRRMRPGADDAFSNLLEDVANDCKATQATLNSSCDAWSSIKMHFFFVCLAQILVVVQHIRLHTIGELKDLSYPYHYYAQDALFLGVGVAAVGVIIVAAASVTDKCNEIKAKVKAVAYDHDTKFRASILSNVVNDHLSGVTCWGEPVNQQKIVMIMWGFTVVIFTIIVELLGAKFNIHKNTPAIAL